MCVGVLGKLAAYVDGNLPVFTPAYDCVSAMLARDRYTGPVDLEAFKAITFGGKESAVGNV